MSEIHQARQDRQDFYNHFVYKTKPFRCPNAMAFAFASVFISAMRMGKKDNPVCQRIALNISTMR